MRISGQTQSFLRKTFAAQKTQNKQKLINKNQANIEGALSGLRQLLTTERPLKMIKNAFNLTSKALSVLKIFKLLS